MDYIIVFLITSIVTLIGAAAVFIGTLFIGGTSSIVTYLSFADSITSEVAFLVEKGLWGTEHHINNFCATILTGAAPLFFLRYFENYKQIYSFKKFMIRFTYVVFFSVIGIVGIYAIIGEVIEQCGRKIIKSFIGNNTAGQVFFEGYSSETLDDVILSDLFLQYLITSIEALLFLIFVFESRAALFFFKRGWVLFFRLVLKLLLPVIGFLGTVRKDFGSGYAWPIGFYALICLKLAIICFLFLEDYIHIKNSEKARKYLTIKELVDIYTFLLIYVITQYIVTFNLQAWSVIITHVVALAFIFILFSLKIKVRGKLKSMYEPIVPYNIL